MPKFGKRSQKRLDTCHSDLIRLFTLVVRYFDCTILEGHRGKEKQNRYYDEGKSKVQWPDGSHNSYPSEGIDTVPYPVKWPDYGKIAAVLEEIGLDSKAKAFLKRKIKTFAKNLARFYFFGGFVLGLAVSMGLKIRWGGDWDSDREILDQNFDDLPHFERED